MNKYRARAQQSGQSLNGFSTGDLDIVLLAMTAAAALRPLPPAKLLAGESVLRPEFNNSSGNNGGKFSAQHP